MFLDHVTFAVDDLDAAVARMEQELAVVFGPATHTIPGITGRVARLNRGFLELMTVDEPERAELAPFGKNLARYLDERGAGIFSATLCTGDIAEFQRNIPEGVPHCGPIVTWVPQPNGSKVHFSSLFFGRYHLMPWVIEYRGEAPAADHPMRLTGVTINVEDLDEAIGSYAAAYGLAQPSGRTVRDRHGVPDAAELELADGVIRLRQAAPLGISVVALTGEAAGVEIAVDAAGATYAWR